MLRLSLISIRIVKNLALWNGGLFAFEQEGNETKSIEFLKPFLNSRTHVRTLVALVPCMKFNPHSRTSESLAAPYTAAFAHVNSNHSSPPAQLLSAHPPARGPELRLISFPDLRLCKSQSVQTTDMPHGTAPVRQPVIPDIVLHNSRRSPPLSAGILIVLANRRKACYRSFDTRPDKPILCRGTSSSSF